MQPVFSTVFLAQMCRKVAKTEVILAYLRLKKECKRRYVFVYLSVVDSSNAFIKWMDSESSGILIMGI